MAAGLTYRVHASLGGRRLAAEASPDGSRLEKRLIPFDESVDRARKALQHERYLEQLEEFVEMARGEADWWVKAEYRDHLPEGIEPTLEEAPW